MNEPRMVCTCAKDRRLTRPAHLTAEGDLICESCIDLAMRDADFDVIYVRDADDVTRFADALETEGFVVHRASGGNHEPAGV